MNAACALPAAAFREKDARDIVMAAQVRDRIFIRPTFVRSFVRKSGSAARYSRVSWKMLSAAYRPLPSTSTCISISL